MLAADSVSKDALFLDSFALVDSFHSIILNMNLWYVCVRERKTKVGRETGESKCSPGCKALVTGRIYNLIVQTVLNILIKDS